MGHLVAKSASFLSKGNEILSFRQKYGKKCITVNYAAKN